MPQITKRPFMAAVMLASAPDVKSFGMPQRHILARTSPGIVRKPPDFSPVN